MRKGKWGEESRRRKEERGREGKGKGTKGKEKGKEGKGKEWEEGRGMEEFCAVVIIP